MPKHGASNELEYNQITDDIFIGTNMCCQMHFEKELLKKGIEVDISLEGEKIDSPEGIDFFVWLPVKDHTPPTQEQLEYGVRAIKDFIEMGKKIYIHCQNGHGRAPTLVAAYMIGQGKTPSEAIEIIKLKRPSIHLEDSQVEALEKYAQKK